MNLSGICIKFALVNIKLFTKMIRFYTGLFVNVKITDLSVFIGVAAFFDGITVNDSTYTYISITFVLRQLRE